MPEPKLLAPYFCIVQCHLSLTLSRERERTQDVPAQKLIFRKQKQKGSGFWRPGSSTRD
jgi:hypothetical protein